MKKTPFHEVGLAQGAKMVELFGYYLPWEYSAGHEKEHLGTRTRLQASAISIIWESSSSRDRMPESLVQKLATNDYSKKAIGSVQYTAMCDFSRQHDRRRHHMASRPK